MREHELPTWNDIIGKTVAELDTARDGLSEARDWLASDWRPLGIPLSDEAAAAREEARRAIGQAQAALDAATSALYTARDGTGR